MLPSAHAPSPPSPVSAESRPVPTSRRGTGSAARRRNENPPGSSLPGGSRRDRRGCASVAALAEELEQHQEQIDEIEVEAERPHDRLLAGDLPVIIGDIHLLDLLRVEGGEADEDHDAD